MVAGPRGYREEDEGLFGEWRIWECLVALINV